MQPAIYYICSKVAPNINCVQSIDRLLHELKMGVYLEIERTIGRMNCLIIGTLTAPFGSFFSVHEFLDLVCELKSKVSG